MEDFKITKGKWRIGNKLSNLVFTDRFEQSIVIAQWDGAVVTQNEAIANAKLISKAPEMRSILETILQLEEYKKLHGKDDSYTKVKQKAHEIIDEILKSIK